MRIVLVGLFLLAFCFTILPTKTSSQCLKDPDTGSIFQITTTTLQEYKGILHINTQMDNESILAQVEASLNKDVAKAFNPTTCPQKAQ